MTIPTLSTLPTAPARTDAPATFVTRADAFLAALVTFQGEMNTSIAAMNTDIASVNANVTLASEWAVKNDAAVSGSDWSAYANASGAAPTGSAKAWATTAQDTPVAGGEYSAKHYSGEASDSATAAAASATAAANTANAAMWVSGQSYAEGDNAISGVNYKTYRATTATSGTTDPSASGDWVSLAYALPSQTGNSGKFLTTNGTNESWDDVLPSQTGNAGKVLTTDGTTDTWEYAIADQSGQSGLFLTTDGTTTSWAAAGGAGTGGATTACPATLTSSSDSAHILTATTWGAVLTLPDATTMDESLPTFGFYNQSHYDIPIENTSGTLLGYVLAGDSTMCSLIDNSTAAGTWRFSNPQPLGDYASVMDLAPQTQSVSLWGYERVTDSKWMVCYQLGSYMYARVYNESNRTWGSAVLVHAKGNSGHIGIQKVEDDKMILSYSYNGATSNWARVASVSGETITLGTEDTEAAGAQTYRAANFYKVGTDSFVHIRRNTSNQIDLIGYKVSGTTVTSGTKYTFNGQNYILRPIGNTGQDTGFCLVSYDASVGNQYSVQTFYVDQTTAAVTNIAGTTVSSTITTAPAFVSNQTTNGNLLFFYRSNTGAPLAMCVSATASNVTASTTSASSPTLAFNPDGPIGYMQDGNIALLIFESDSSNYISGFLIEDVSGTCAAEAENWVANEGAMMIGEGSDGIYALSSHPNRKDGYMHRYYIDTSNPQAVPNREYVEYFYQLDFANVNYYWSWYGNRFNNSQKIEVGNTDTFSREFGGSTYQVNGQNFTLESARYRTITRQEGGGFAKGVFDKTANQVIAVDARRTSFKQEYGVGYNNTSLADCAQGWDVWAEQNTDTPSNEYFVRLTLRRLADA